MPLHVPAFFFCERDSFSVTTPNTANGFEDAITDDQPVLASVDPVFETAPEAEDIDLSDLPDFLPLQGQLPSARFHVKRQLADVQDSLPDEWLEGKAPTGAEALKHLAAMDEMFMKVEALVLERAADREAMTDWLCKQENGEAALMAAFGKLSESLGN